MIYPKFCINRTTKEKEEVVSVDFEKKVATIIGKRNQKIQIPLKDADFDYADMDLDDMYVFLRAMYSPKDTVKKICEARNI